MAGVQERTIYPAFNCFAHSSNFSVLGWNYFRFVGVFPRSSDADWFGNHDQSLAIAGTTGTDLY